MMKFFECCVSCNESKLTKKLTLAMGKERKRERELWRRCEVKSIIRSGLSHKRMQYFKTSHDYLKVDLIKYRVG